MAEGYFANFEVLESKYPGISTWTPEEVKDIPADLTYRRSVNGVTYTISAVADLLDNPQYIDYKKGYNPTFRCLKCKGEAFETHIQHPKSSDMIELRIKGKRVCRDCFTNTPHKLTPTGYEFI